MPSDSSRDEVISHVGIGQAPNTGHVLNGLLPSLESFAVAAVLRVGRSAQRRAAPLKTSGSVS